MKIDTTIQKKRNCQGGFTLMEVAIASAIAGLLMVGLFQGYTMAGEQAQFSACNLAANAQAMKQLEQVEAADWIPSYGQNALLTMGSTATGNLCLPIANGSVINCTNITTVSQISSTPPYALIQSQCIWKFPMSGKVYTNTVAVLRAPNI